MAIHEINRVKPSAAKLEDYEMEHIPLNSLKIDRSYQRELNHDRVKRMVKTFSPALVLPFAVNMRTNGELFTVDGQHRTAMLVALGKGDAEVPCALYYGLTIAEEAWLFDELNKRQAKLTPLQQFRGGVAAGDAVAMAINQAAEDAGFVINPDRRGREGSNIPAVASLKHVRSQYGMGGLAKTLHLIAATWGTEHGPSGDIIKHVADFIYRYESRFDVNRFVRVFGGIDTIALTKEVKVNKVTGGMDFDTAWNFKLTEIYNKNIRAQNRLPTILELRARQRPDQKGARYE